MKYLGYIRTVLLIACLAEVSLSFPASAQNSPSATSPSANTQAVDFAGCYQLQMDRWWPWSMGEDTQFATPPSKFQLTLQRGTARFERDNLLIRQIPDSGPSRRAAYWMLAGPDVAALIWSDGFSGVSINFRKNGNELRGWAHAHFDSPRAPHWARVKASPIACQ